MFTIIEIIIRLIGLWNQFTDFLYRDWKAKQEKKRQELDKAVEESKKAETNDEIWKTEDDITRNLP